MKKRYDNLRQRVGFDDAARENTEQADSMDSAALTSIGKHMLSQSDGDEFLSKDMPEGNVIAILEGWLANIGRRRDVH